MKLIAWAAARDGDTLRKKQRICTDRGIVIQLTLEQGIFCSKGSGDKEGKQPCKRVKGGHKEQV